MQLDLKKDVTFSLGENRGYHYFPKSEYAATVVISEVNDVAKEFAAKVAIINKITGKYTGRDIFPPIPVDPLGIDGAMLNETAVNTYKAELKAIEDQQKAKRDRQQEIKGELKDNTLTEEQRQALNDEAETLGIELVNLAAQYEAKIQAPVEPQFEKIDKYDEIKTLFSDYKPSQAAFDFLKRRIPELETIVTLPNPK